MGWVFDPGADFCSLGFKVSCAPHRERPPRPSARAAVGPHLSALSPAALPCGPALRLRLRLRRAPRGHRYGRRLGSAGSSRASAARAETPATRSSPAARARSVGARAAPPRPPGARPLRGRGGSGALPSPERRRRALNERRRLLGWASAASELRAKRRRRPRLHRSAWLSGG